MHMVWEERSPPWLPRWRVLVSWETLTGLRTGILRLLAGSQRWGRVTYSSGAVTLELHLQSHFVYLLFMFLGSTWTDLVNICVFFSWVFLWTPDDSVMHFSPLGPPLCTLYALCTHGSHLFWPNKILTEDTFWGGCKTKNVKVFWKLLGE